MNIRYILGFLLFIGASSIAMQPAPKEQIEAIIKKYNISPKTCHIAANKEVSSEGYIPNLEIACLVAGLKDVYYMYSPDEINTMDPDIKAILPHLDINYITYSVPSYFGGKKEVGFMYTPKGKRNALLFAKYDLEKTLNAFKHDYLENNIYLIGSLLNYSEEDKEFFAMLNDFFDRYNTFLYADTRESTHTSDDLRREMPPTSFPDWKEEDKNQFAFFEKRIWPISNARWSFAKDQKAAFKWIRKNHQFTDDQLLQQIEALKKELNEIPEKTIKYSSDSEEEVYPEGS